MKIRIRIGLFLLTTVFVFTYPTTTFAKRLLPQVQKQQTDVKTGKRETKGVAVIVKFRSDRNAINSSFTNLKIAKEVHYKFSYKNGDNVEQASEGSLDLTQKEPITREFLFGTCSTDNVCRYDTGIHDAKFVVTTNLLTGKKVIKTFILKVKK